MDWSVILSSLGIGAFLGSILTKIFSYVIDSHKESRVLVRQKRESIGKFILNLIYTPPEKIMTEDNVIEVMKVSSQLKHYNKNLSWAVRMFVFHTGGAYFEDGESSKKAREKWEFYQNYLEEEANKLLGKLG